MKRIVIVGILIGWFVPTSWGQVDYYSAFHPDISITGSFNPDSTIQVEFTGGVGRMIDGYQWYYGDSSTYSILPGATSQTYVISDSLSGYWPYCVVTPIAATGGRAGRSVGVWGDSIYVVDSSRIGLIAKWSSYYENHVDSLTFNSTGLTISSIDGANVTMSAVTGLFVGSSCRFANPLSGTLYTILVINGNIITLDKTCTASATNELYQSCIGSIQDHIGTNHAAQTTGIMQPKTLWFGTDTNMVKCDGSDDSYALSSFIDWTDYESWTITAWIDYEGTETGYYEIFSGRLASIRNINSKIYHFSPSEFKSNEAVNSGINYLVVSCTGNVVTFYINGIVSGSFESCDCNYNELNKRLTYLGQRGDDSEFWNGLVDDWRVYNRALTPTEIANYYENSRFYSE
jgi:hypothetical protein